MCMCVCVLLTRAAGVIALAVAFNVLASGRGPGVTAGLVVFSLKVELVSYVAESGPSPPHSPADLRLAQ